MLLTMNKRGVITISREIREELGLDEGDALDARIEKGRIVLEPVAVVPRTMRLTEHGRAKEAAADADVRRGRVKRFEDAKGLLGELDENRKNR